MAKKKHKHHMHRNGIGSRVRQAVRRGAPPDLSTTLASAAGGGGGALLGGFLVNRGWSPEAVSAAMLVGGGLAAYLGDGNMRVAGNGLAAAGAGQLALTLMSRSAEKDEKKETKDKRQVAELSPGTVENAFERARRRLAAAEDDEDRFDDAIDVDGEERAAA